MKLQHQTEVGARAEDVWAFLQDTHAVARCLPGAELTNELGDDRYEGMLRIAIGPLKMNYAGNVHVVERNAEAHRMALKAAGRDKRGSGAAEAHVQLQVKSVDGGSRIEVISDIDLSGRIASLGRGVRDVSNRMFVQFADQLRDRIEQPEQGRDKTAPAPTPLPSGQSAITTPATTAGTKRAQTSNDQKAGEIKVLQLVWTVTRERLAEFLEKLSVRVRPR